jgi:hypothetical protein
MTLFVDQTHAVNSSVSPKRRETTPPPCRLFCEGAPPLGAPCVQTTHSIDLFRLVTYRPTRATSAYSTESRQPAPHTQTV